MPCRASRQHLWRSAVNIVVLVGVKRWRATPAGELAFDRFKLHLPIAGQVVHKTAIARFSQTLAALVRSGVSIMEALDIVAGTAGNAVIAAAIRDACGTLCAGESLSVALMSHGSVSEDGGA